MAESLAETKRRIKVRLLERRGPFTPLPPFLRTTGEDLQIVIDGLGDMKDFFETRLMGAIDKAQRSVVAESIKEVVRKAESGAAVAEAPYMRRYRRSAESVRMIPGTLRRAIGSETFTPTRHNVIGNMFIREGSGDKDDAFHWRFVEFGTQHVPARPFIRPAGNESDRKIEGAMSRRLDSEIDRSIRNRGRSTTSDIPSVGFLEEVVTFLKE